MTKTILKELWYADLQNWTTYLVKILPTAGTEYTMNPKLEEDANGNRVYVNSHFKTKKEALDCLKRNIISKLKFLNSRKYKLDRESHDCINETIETDNHLIRILKEYREL